MPAETQFARALTVTEVVVLTVACFFGGLPFMLVKLSEKSKP